MATPAKQPTKEGQRSMSESSDIVEEKPKVPVEKKVIKNPKSSYNQLLGRPEQPKPDAFDPIQFKESLKQQQQPKVAKQEELSHSES